MISMVFWFWRDADGAGLRMWERGCVVVWVPVWVKDFEGAVVNADVDADGRVGESGWMVADGGSKCGIGGNCG